MRALNGNKRVNYEERKWKGSGESLVYDESSFANSNTGQTLFTEYATRSKEPGRAKREEKRVKQGANGD